MRGHRRFQTPQRRPLREPKQGGDGEKPGEMDRPGREAFIAATVANLPCPGTARLGHSPPQPWLKPGPEPPPS